MHHLGVKKSNPIHYHLASAENKKLGSAGNHDQPLSPKPRRVAPAIPEFLKPQRCNKHSSFLYTFFVTGQQNSDERSGILNMVTEKEIVDGRQYVCTKCSPACYSGSPPGRANNPLVHDVQFLDQWNFFLHSQKQSSQINLVLVSLPLQCDQPQKWCRLPICWKN